jgi:carbamoyltransferase
MREILVLGFSLGFDTGAAIVSSKRGIVAAINQERINRKKNTKALPIDAIQEVLKLSCLSPEDVDYVTYTHYEKEDFFNLAKRMSPDQMSILTGRQFGLLQKMNADPNFVRAYRKNLANSNEDDVEAKILLENMLWHIGFPPQELIRVDHHWSHAAPAFVYSGFDDALVITADGFGDDVSGRIVKMNSGFKSTVLSEVPLTGSIALIYQFVTGGVGYRMHEHEGKITGLSARGDASKTRELFSTLIDYAPESQELVWSRAFRNVPNVSCNPIKDFHGFMKLQEHIFKFCKEYYTRKDLAAGVQELTEKMVLKWINGVKQNHSFNTLNLKNVCLAGGLFANVKLNQEVFVQPWVDNCFVFPAMGDTGGAVGSATAFLYSLEEIGPMRLQHAFLGSSIGSETEIVNVLQENGLDYVYTGDRGEAMAALVIGGNIVANVNGKLEYGPRALCHRSIHFHCDDEMVNDWLNKQLGRSEYMPFCPAIRIEDATEAFKDFREGNSVAGEFMTTDYYATDAFKKQCPSGVHVDNTARAQLVRKEIIPDMYRALECYKSKTGKMGFINTSFNEHGEPIVRTAAEAVKRFLSSNIHYLVIENLVVRHPKYDEIRKFEA